MKKMEGIYLERRSHGKWGKMIMGRARGSNELNQGYRKISTLRQYFGLL